MSDDYALSFDGIDDYIEVPHHSALNLRDFTITLWIKVVPASRGIILTKGNGRTAGYPFALVLIGATGRPRLIVSDFVNFTLLDYPTSIDDNAWHFLVAQRDTVNRKLRLRIDTRPWEVVDDLVTGDTGNNQPMLWASNLPRRLFLNGALDEMKIYNRVLKDYEIDYWWNNGQGRYGYGSELGLVAGYHLDEGSGTTAEDFSGHGHRGQIFGALWTLGYVRKGVITMPEVVSHVILSVSLPEGAPERVTEKWAEWLKGNADRMLQGIRERFPNETYFQSGLAEPAHKKYREYVNPTYVSRAGSTGTGIRNSHLANLMDAFKKYRDAIESAFANTAAWFKSQVDLGKAHFSEGVAKRTLLFTGTRREQRGPAPITALWLTADPITLRLLRAGDTVIEGGPYRICPETKKPGLKVLLNQRLIQAGVEIIKSGMDVAVIAAQNQLTAEQVQGFVDPTLDLIPFVAGGDSHVDYIVIDGNLYLEIKVSKM